MIKKKINYRVAIVSSLIIALITSFNRTLTLSYHDWYPICIVFIINFSAALFSWLIIYLTDSFLRRFLVRTDKSVIQFSTIIKNQLIRLSVSSMVSLVFILSILALMYPFFLRHDSFLFNAAFSFHQFMDISAIRVVTLIIAIQMIKNMFDLLDERQKILIENEKLKLATLNAQFQSLKQQLNPHFLFNSLNTLKSMVKSNDPHAEAFVMRLAEIYRYLLQNQHNDLVTIREELTILHAFIFMLKARFEESLIVTINVDDALLDTFLLPPFTMQLLIENATKHNIVSQAKPLYIEVFQVGKERIVVKNSLQLKRNVEESTGIGLENINKRCIYLCGKGIVIIKTESAFIVEIPIIANDANSYS